MGYNTATIRIPLRLDNHGGIHQREDREAADDLAFDIRELIKENPHYERIAILGVEGP
jgi:hypothetical protein